MSKLFLAAGAILGFFGVAAGAFGAHALRALRSERELQIFETGARYHLIHAVLLVLVGLFAASRPTPLVHAAGGALLGGVLVFSGSLYLLVLLQKPALGAITPIGGLLLLAGWALLAVEAIKG